MQENDPGRRDGQSLHSTNGAQTGGGAPPSVSDDLPVSNGDSAEGRAPVASPVSGGDSPGRGRETEPAAEAGVRRSMRSDRDLTTGSIPRNLYFLAWPQVVEGATNAMDQLLDLFWAGLGVGARGIASIGVAQNYIMLIRLGRMGIDLGIRAMISRAIGEGDLKLANHVMLQGFMINLIMAALTVIPGIIFTDFLLRILGASDALVAVGTSYMQVQFVASLFQGFRLMTSAALQAAGDTFTPMKGSLLGRGIDWVLTPVVMFGLLGLPEFGLVGVALVNVLSNFVGFAMNAYGLLTGSSRLTLTFRGFYLDWRLIWSLVKLSIPASVTNAERSLVQIVVIGMVATFGDFALAAFALTRRAEFIANLGSQGLGNAAGIIAGQSIGAGVPQRARATVWWALGYVTILRMVLAGLLLLFPAFFISIFSREPEMLEAGVIWLQILALSFFFQGLVQVFQQTFQIAGDTFMTMVITLSSGWLVEVPLAAILGGLTVGLSIFGWPLPLPEVTFLGQYGIAWAISFGMAFRLLIFIPYFLWGPWTSRAIFGGRASGFAAAYRGGGGGD